jgi:hypothetical protein
MAWLFFRYEPYVAPEDADVVINAAASCECHLPWVRELRNHDLAVSIVLVRDVLRIEAQLGVPREFSACHTGVANGYWIEGHVPAVAVRQLLQEAPNGVGGLAHLRAVEQTSSEIDWEVVTYDKQGRATFSRRVASSADGDQLHEPDSR